MSDKIICDICKQEIILHNDYMDICECCGKTAHSKCDTMLAVSLNVIWCSECRKKHHIKEYQCAVCKQTILQNDKEFWHCDKCGRIACNQCEARIEGPNELTLCLRCFIEGRQ